MYKTHYKMKKAMKWSKFLKIDNSMRNKVTSKMKISMFNMLITLFLQIFKLNIF